MPKRALLSVLAVAAVSMASTLLAQDAPKRPYQRPEAGQQRPAAGAVASRMQGEGDKMRAVLESMNDEQKAALRDMTETLRSTSREKTEQLLMARRALGEASFGEKPDEAQIRVKAAEMGKLEGELAIDRSRVFAEHRAKFSPEQQQAIRLMLSMPPGAGGMPGGRPGGADAGDGKNRHPADGLYGRPSTPQEEFRKPRPPEEPKQ